MKTRAKAVFLILFLFVGSLLLSSCFVRHKIIERQTEYHESIQEIEEHILAYLGDYVAIQEVDIDLENQSVSLNVFFVSSYVNEDQKDKSYPEVMEEFRTGFNEFLNDNPDYFLTESLYISVNFLRAPEFDTSSLPYENYGVITNKLSSSDYPEETLCCVNYGRILEVFDCSRISFEGIKEINLCEYDDADSILNLIEKMPDIEVVHVRSNLEQSLSELQMDIVFV